MGAHAACWPHCLPEPVTCLQTKAASATSLIRPGLWEAWRRERGRPAGRGADQVLAASGRSLRLKSSCSRTHLPRLCCWHGGRAEAQGPETAPGERG